MEKATPASTCMLKNNLHQRNFITEDLKFFYRSWNFTLERERELLKVGMRVRWPPVKKVGTMRWHGKNYEITNTYLVEFNNKLVEETNDLICIEKLFY